MQSYLLIISARAPFVSSFAFPDTVPLHARQAPGTPQYACHEDCGSIITKSRSEGFCDQPDFASTVESCLDCANEYDIWQYYGTKVSAAAEECGLESTPEPADGEDAATSSAAISSNSVASETSIASTAAASNGTVSAIIEPTAAASSTIPAAPSSNSTVNSAAPSSTSESTSSETAVATGSAAVVAPLVACSLLTFVIMYTVS